MAFWPHGIGGGDPFPFEGALAQGASPGFGFVVSTSAANVLSAWTTVCSVTPDYSYGFIIEGTIDVNSTSLLLDIGVATTTGAEKVIASQLPAYQLNQGATALKYEFNVYIPKGVKLICRGQSRAANTRFIQAQIYGMRRHLSHAGAYSKVVTYGVNTADSMGTNVSCLVTATLSTTIQSNFTELTASTTDHIYQMYVVIHNGGDDTRGASQNWYEIGIGAAGNERILIPRLRARNNATADMIMPGVWGPYSVNIPKGSRLSGRGVAVNAVDTVDFLLVGVS